ncbi:cytidine deaminase [Arthroderma uncinatum]|uniref:cytidine deaminase n=1 Tax=Arthroderma uncinatum TaxID=74035 RepID=UPI00144AAF06|nr:cytidine deaminase [Arthroderma uncinatum]KAF3481925.1 cytidine deaminase [Arthroderma uncinatum]
MSASITAAELETLSQKAIAAKDRAYCVYSKFRVGACLLTESGEFITGVNVENVSYPVGVCAERCAMGTAVAAGHTRFKAIAVATDITPGASPCGMCRQFMRQFCALDFPIYMYDGQGKYTMRTMGELLPASFSPADLPPPDS